MNKYNTHKHVLFNKRINDNLEQQAQALFKSWFVENASFLEFQYPSIFFQIEVKIY